MKNIIRKTSGWFRTDTIKDSREIDDIVRKRLYIIFVIFLAVPLVLFGTMHLMHGFLYIAVINNIVVAVLLTCIVAMKYLNKWRLVFRVTSVIIGGVLTGWIYVGKFGGYPSIFILTYPLFTFYLLGRREGLVLTSIMCVITVLVFVNPFGMPGAHTYSFDYYIRHMIALAIIVLFTYNYESLREYFGNEIEIERNKLQERNRIIEHELMLARSIQESMIPSKPVADFIHSLYLPMEELGGDFYDFIRFPDSDKIGIFLSDVSGHGVHAAFITSMIKTTILQAGDRIHDPSGLLMYMNNVLQHQLAGNFITAFYCIYDPRARSLHYSNAGHPQPYIITDEAVDQLQGGKNTVMAMFPDNMLERVNKRYVNFTETLPPNSKILLYTDGLIEARPIGDSETFFEYENLKNILYEYKDASCDIFINKIYDRLVEFRGGNRFNDDICMIGIDVR